MPLPLRGMILLTVFAIPSSSQAVKSNICQKSFKSIAPVLLVCIPLCEHDAVRAPVRLWTGVSVRVYQFILLTSDLLLYTSVGIVFLERSVAS